MIMTVESFILYNIIMWVMGWYLLVRNGEREYEAGVLEAVQLHSEGRLTYVSYREDGIEMLEIKVEPYED